MKSLNEIRYSFDLNPQEQSTSVKYLKRNSKDIEIDWDVYLPTINKNLQRDFVWDIEQKRELIWSILLGRHIPHLAIINSICDENFNKDKYLIIDGKQRLSTIFKFIDDEFSILIEGSEYLFSELPNDYKNAILNYYFRTYMVNEQFDNRITDQDKINWFKFINFSGTPQDKEHLESLK
jgi:uncharacterized protein with ParB-like and HNH nuclease domain